MCHWQCRAVSRGSGQGAGQMAQYPSCQSSSPHIPPSHRGETEPQGGWGTWACGLDVSREGRYPRSATIFPLVTSGAPVRKPPVLPDGVPSRPPSHSGPATIPLVLRLPGGPWPGIQCSTCSGELCRNARPEGLGRSNSGEAAGGGGGDWHPQTVPDPSLDPSQRLPCGEGTLPA